MSTDVKDIAFVQASNSVAVYLRDDPNSVSPIEAVAIDMQDAGVFVETSVLRQFIPYANVAEIRQSV